MTQSEMVGVEAVFTAAVTQAIKIVGLSGLKAMSLFGSNEKRVPKAADHVVEVTGMKSP